MSGLGMEPARLEPDLGAWRAEGTGRGVAVASSATLRIDDEPLIPERPFSLRWAWHWRSVADQAIELDRIVAVARADAPESDPSPVAGSVLARNCQLGWRAVLAAHEAAWDERWLMSDVDVEGDEDVQQALRFAVFHLTSSANPEDERVSVGARGLTGDAYFGHVFWDTEIYLVPFYTAVWPEAARALLMYHSYLACGARKGGTRGLQGSVVCLGIG